MDSSRVKRLILKAQKGDTRAFEKLIRSKSKNISYIAMSILKNRQDAEDAAQDAIEAMLSHIMALQNADAFETWMYRIVFRACLKIQDKGKKQSSTDIEEISSMDMVEVRSYFLPQENSEKAETSRLLLDKIKELPENYRNCMYLFYYEDMTYEQIANVLGSSIKDVSNWLERGRRKLKAEFGADQTSEKKPAALEASMLMSAFALDIRETVADNDVFKDVLQRLFADGAARGAGGILSTTAGKLALAGVVVVAIGLGGLLLTKLLPHNGDSAATPASYSEVSPARATTDQSTPDPDDVREGELTQSDTREEGSSNSSGAPQAGSEGGNVSTPSESGASASIGGFVIENEVLYGSDDASDLDNPNAEEDPEKTSNEVTTTVPIGQQEATSNGSALPLSKTGDFVWRIVVACGAAALAASAALVAARCVKRRQGDSSSSAR